MESGPYPLDLCHVNELDRLLGVTTTHNRLRRRLRENGLLLSVFVLKRTERHLPNDERSFRFVRGYAEDLAERVDGNFRKDNMKHIVAVSDELAGRVRLTRAALYRALHANATDHSDGGRIVLNTKLQKLLNISHAALADNRLTSRGNFFRMEDIMKQVGMQHKALQVPPPTRLLSPHKTGEMLGLSDSERLSWTEEGALLSLRIRDEQQIEPTTTAYSLDYTNMLAAQLAPVSSGQRIHVAREFAATQAGLVGRTLSEHAATFQQVERRSPRNVIYMLTREAAALSGLAHDTIQRYHESSVDGCAFPVVPLQPFKSALEWRHAALPEHS